MARPEATYGENLKRLSELDDYKVESSDPDPRGWTVHTADGRNVGVVDDLVVDTSAMKVRHLLVRDSSGGVGGRNDVSGNDLFVLDTADVDVRHSSRQVVARSYDAASRRAWAGGAAGVRSGHDRDRAIGSDRERKTMTRSEEELRVGTREVQRGEAVVGKHVESEHVSRPVTRQREEIVAERRPVAPGSRRDATFSDDEVRIPLKEEEVVVDKRPVVKEELVVGKRTVEDHDTVEADVRREEFDIDTNAARDPRSRPRGDR